MSTSDRGIAANLFLLDRPIPALLPTLVGRLIGRLKEAHLQPHYLGWTTVKRGSLEVAVGVGRIDMFRVIY